MNEWMKHTTQDLMLGENKSNPMNILLSTEESYFLLLKDRVAKG